MKPGDVGLVIGAGPIGLVTALVAPRRRLRPRLRLRRRRGEARARRLARRRSPRSTSARRTSPKTVLAGTDGWGADVVVECSGNPRGAAGIFEPLCPGGRVVFIGGQSEPIAYDVGAAMVREARVEHVFRYAHVFPRCIAMLSSGAIDVKPLITRTFGFDDSVEAFELAASAPAGEVKMQIELPQ